MDFVDDFPMLPWAEDPIGYWHFEPDFGCRARFASGIVWKEPGDLLNVEVAGELNARWGGSLAGSDWESPSFVRIESLDLQQAPISHGPPGLYTSRGVVTVTRIEASGARGEPSQPRRHSVAALVHGDGNNLYQAVSIVTMPDVVNARCPVVLDGEAVLEMWSEAGSIGMDAFRSAIGVD